MKAQASPVTLLLLLVTAVTADSKGGQQKVEPIPRPAKCPEIQYTDSDVCPNTQRECARRADCQSDQSCCYDGCRFYCADLRPVCPEFCLQPRESSEQVCGSDGRTYRSLCLLEKAACDTGVTITKESDGPCASEKCGQCGEQQQQQQQVQQYAHDLVCGSDGVTYTSLCDLKKTACLMGETISVSSQGPCPQVMCGIYCENPGGPVCGSDYRTYDSSCSLRNTQCSESGLTLLYEGRCRLELIFKPRFCPKPDPHSLPGKGAYCRDSCSSDVDCTEAEKCCPGSCGKKCAIPLSTSSLLEGCPILCPRKLDPVCASDGHTYPNECRVDSVRKCGANPVYTLYKGACK